MGEQQIGHSSLASSSEERFGISRMGDRSLRGAADIIKGDCCEKCKNESGGGSKNNCFVSESIF